MSVTMSYLINAMGFRFLQLGSWKVISLWYVYFVWRSLCGRMFTSNKCCSRFHRSPPSCYQFQKPPGGVPALLSPDFVDGHQYSSDGRICIQTCWEYDGHRIDSIVYDSLLMLKLDFTQVGIGAMMLMLVWETGQMVRAQNPRVCTWKVDSD